MVHIAPAAGGSQCRAIADNRHIDRDFGPPKQSKAVARNGVFHKRFTESIGIFIGGHEEHTDRQIISGFNS